MAEGSQFHNILTGNLDNIPPLPKTTVKIYICSNPEGKCVYNRGSQESQAQFKNRIKPRVYALRVVQCTKNLYLLAGTGVREINAVACGFSPIKIRFSDYPKSLIRRIMKFMHFSIKNR